MMFDVSVMSMCYCAAWGRNMPQWTAFCYPVSMCRICHQRRWPCCFTSHWWPCSNTRCWVARSFWLDWPACWWYQCRTVICHWHKWCSYQDCTTQQMYDTLLPFLLFWYHVFFFGVGGGGGGVQALVDQCKKWFRHHNDKLSEWHLLVGIRKVISCKHALALQEPWPS